MMKLITNLIAYIHNAMQRSLSYSMHQVVAVGFIICFGFPLFYWIWTEWFPQPYESLSLRLIGSFLGLGLVLSPYWPERWKRYLPWYWFCTILYSLSFFFAFSFLMNYASVISAMSLLCSVFLLVLLVDLPSLVIFIVLGWGIAFIIHYLSLPLMMFGEEHMEMLVMVIFVIAAGSAVSHKTAVLQQQKLDGIAAAAGMIAHELRTPLLGIKSGAAASTHYFPQLIEAYLLAKEHGLLQHTLRDSRLQQLREVNQRIISETDYANTIIDMLLIKAGRDHSLQNCIMEPCSMAECLNEALARYPFKNDEEKQLISLQGDFKFIGSKLLMQHILFNLIKNALYAIATAQKGCITVWTETDSDCNRLYFEDTAKGMSTRQQARLFSHFYTTTFMGTGLGLSFCKLVMNHFGGDITCSSQEGEYARFVMSFPVMPSP
ncbi:sensor histidine kinase [Legionella dresdenensis]|uniref:histidine kinase n=1 Tax=Legionella dresdenensis TaxID=450200 RepID=A0ABV8CCG0_9GAMM